MGFLEKISKTYKDHPKNWVYSYAKAEKTYPKAKAKVEAGKTTGTTCVVPIKWALKLMGLNPDGFYGYKGGFRGFDSDLKKVMKKKASGGPIGYTVKQAVNKGLLKTGDIIAFKGRTHTVVYSGQGYKVYEGGGAAKRAKYKNGILLDYSKVLTYRGRKISCICRWL